MKLSNETPVLPPPPERWRRRRQIRNSGSGGKNVKAVKRGHKQTGTHNNVASNCARLCGEGCGIGVEHFALCCALCLRTTGRVFSHSLPEPSIARAQEGGSRFVAGASLKTQLSVLGGMVLLALCQTVTARSGCRAGYAIAAKSAYTFAQ